MMLNGVSNSYTDIYNYGPNYFLLMDILCQHYRPGPDSELITVPVLPRALQQDTLYQAHNIPGTGHQGHDKILQKLHLSAYWVGMLLNIV